jgi:hypothetical protein
MSRLDEVRMRVEGVVGRPLDAQSGPAARLLANAPADLQYLLARLDAVRALHYRWESKQAISFGLCRTCKLLYPCPTIRALDGEATQ